MLYFGLVIVGIIVGSLVALLPFYLVLFVGEWIVKHLAFGRPGRLLHMMVKSLRRNLLRTSLTYLATFVLVIVVVLVWSQLHFIDGLVVEKSKDLKVIVSEKWQALSAMPYAYADPLCRGAAEPGHADDVSPLDSMTWQFYAGSLDSNKQTPENQVFFIAMEPAKIPSMLDQLFAEFSTDQGERGTRLRPELLAQVTTLVHQMEQNKRGVVMGRERLNAIHKRVGERFVVTGQNYKGIDLEFEVLGEFPPGRYDHEAIMNRDYLNDALALYPKTHAGVKHPLADKSLNIVWLLVSNLEAFGRVAYQIDSSARFRDPAVRCQTLSSGIATQLDMFRDLIWGMRWLLSPAVLITMALVISNAISISVRERRGEIAVLKVLGFQPLLILGLVLGEALLIGAVSGMLSSGLTYVLVDVVLQRLNATTLYIPEAALWWGPGLGALTALLGSVIPAWAATQVKVSEVFSKIS